MVASSPVSGHEEHDHRHDPVPDARDGEPEAGDAGAGGDDAPDITAWIASAPRETCPACGAPGAVRLGGGVFCPACGETTTAAGYAAPSPPPADDEES